MKYRYITNRELEDKNGNVRGNIRVIVPFNSNTAFVKYKCPQCLFEENKEKEWKRPFNIKCSKCGYLIRVTRLRDSIKKKR